MEKLEQTLSSVEIADMVEKSHSNLIRDIRRYTDQFNEGKIFPVDFFNESTYKDSKGETRPCYRVTKKGCEFIAHKLTGTKGTVFTARYINRFHEMETELSTGANQEILLYLKEKLEKQDAVLADIKKQTHMRSLPVRSQYTIQDRYRTEIERMVGAFTNQDHLRSVYTVCKTLSS